MLRRITPFLTDLGRRNVYRVAVAYAAAAFVIWQVADIALPAFGFPGWSVTLVVVLTILGFPVALLLAWAYQLTPDGLQKDQGPNAEAEAVSPSASHALEARPLSFAETLHTVGLEDVMDTLRESLAQVREGGRGRLARDERRRGHR